MSIFFNTLKISKHSGTARVVRDSINALISDQWRLESSGVANKVPPNIGYSKGGQPLIH